MSNIIAGILALLFGAIGDLVSRIIWFNCSLDKMWTLLFAIPPFSIVPAIMYFMNKIERAPMACSSVFDVFLILIPVVVIILSVVLPIIITKYDENDEETMMYKIVLMTSIITIFAFARIYKYYSACNKTRKTTKNGNIIMNGILRSLATNLGIMGFNWIASNEYLQLIPIVGTGFSLWNAFGEFFPIGQHLVPLTIVHFVLNMTENSDDFIERICDQNLVN